MDTWLSKLIALILTFILTLLAGLLPIKLISFIRSESGRCCKGIDSHTILGLLNSFCGGVFIAVTMIHLLPEVRHEFHEIFVETKQKSDFPIAEFVTCIGLFIIMFIETVILRCKSKQTHSENTSGRVDGALSRPGEEVSIVRSYCLSGDQKSNLFESIEVKQERSIKNEATENPSELIASGKQVSYGSLVVFQRNEINQISSSDGFDDEFDEDDDDDASHRSGNISPRCRSNFHNSNGYEQLESNSRPKPREDGLQGQQYNNNQHNLMIRSIENKTAHECAQGPELNVDGTTNTLRSLVLLIALSIHTVFEGLALGLQESTTQVWTLFTAIILHKIIMAFTVGLRFIESLGSVRASIIYMLVFSVTSPIGIAIGLLVSEAGSGGLVTSIVSATLQGLATGTFIYVTYFEVLGREMTGNQCCSKVLAVVIGFSCITLTGLFAEHEHHAHHEHAAH